jgi:hypothetical protein
MDGAAKLETLSPELFATTPISISSTIQAYKARPPSCIIQQQQCSSRNLYLTSRVEPLLVQHRHNMLLYSDIRDTDHTVNVNKVDLTCVPNHISCHDHCTSV